MAVNWDAILNRPLQGIFGTAPVRYRVGQEPPFEIRGVFDRRARELLGGGGAAAISAAQAWLWVRLADFPAGIRPAQGDHVMVGLDTWAVADVQPDAHGGAMLPLTAHYGDDPP